MHKNTIIISFIIAIVLIVSGIMYMKTQGNNRTRISYNEDGTFTDTVPEYESTCVLLYVYVCGHVTSPGVYAMDAGSRICDAISAAGGFTDDADIDSVNQALKITDGQRIYIPSHGEAADTGQGEDSGLVNINTADEKQLMTLPGIGESRAKSIITYREESGGFNTIEDIMNVAGIKEAAFSRIKDSICV